MEQNDNHMNNGHNEEGNDRFTERERQVLQYIMEEKSNTQIAQLLDISIRTVDAHKRNMLMKIQGKSIVSLVKYAIREKLYVL